MPPPMPTGEAPASDEPPTYSPDIGIASNAPPPFIPGVGIPSEEPPTSIPVVPYGGNAMNEEPTSPPGAGFGTPLPVVRG
uniref:DUF4190 domain-containing protein n=1 Tax=Macrostomum lignano TaxID=282301 RepID=A0A1I8GE11_9PLAT